MHATNPTWTSLHSSPDRRGESQATDRLSNGTTLIQLIRAVLTFSLCVRERTLSERFVRVIKRDCRGCGVGRTRVANRIPKIIVSCSLQVFSTDDASRRLWGSHKVCAVSVPPAQIPAERNSIHGTTTSIVIAPSERWPHSCSSINLAGNFGIYAIRAAGCFRRTTHRVHFTTAKSIFNLIYLYPKRLL